MKKFPLYFSWFVLALNLYYHTVGAVRLGKCHTLAERQAAFGEPILGISPVTFLYLLILLTALPLAWHIIKFNGSRLQIVLIVLLSLFLGLNVFGVL